MTDPVLSLLLALALAAIGVLLVWPGIGLLPRLRRGAGTTERVLSEDALKYVCKREAKGYPPTVHSVAGNMNISINRMAEILGRLEEKKLVRHDGELLRLTHEGRAVALNVIRAHRLWERYLADETGLGEAEWHDRAERMEHELSPADVERLAARLGSPTHDPHGDPIPTPTRETVFHGGMPLTAAAARVPLRIVHLEDEPEAVFAQLVAVGLRPGMTALVTESTPERVRFFADGDEHILAPIVASNISVVPVPEAEEEPERAPGERLSLPRPGEGAEVVRVSRACRAPERRRLMDLGVLPGTRIAAEMKSPTGGLTAYRVRGAVIALRPEQADRILVKRIDEGSNE
ncbi:MAG: metal-dependent transcriptional regulator [Candidatus Eisenbacteria bacterium]